MSNPYTDEDRENKEEEREKFSFYVIHRESKEGKKIMYTDWIEDINNPYTTGGTFPRYWKNNTIHDLEGGPMTGFGTGQANDIRVADGNVIVVGIATRGPNYDDSGESACYWLNGELHYLDDVIGEYFSEAKGVFIE